MLLTVRSLFGDFLIACMMTLKSVVRALNLLNLISTSNGTPKSCVKEHRFISKIQYYGARKNKCMFPEIIIIIQERSYSKAAKFIQKDTSIICLQLVNHELVFTQVEVTKIILKTKIKHYINSLSVIRP